MSWQIGAALQHLRRRSPIRPFPFHAYSLGARPGEALPTYPNAILDRLSVSEDVVEAALTGRDDHCARTKSLAPRHNLARDSLHAEDIEKVGKTTAYRVV